MASRDYYAALGVSRKASSDEVKKAFRSLALRHHPDRNPGDEGAQGRFREISEAWHTLGDPERRARYDRLGPLYRADGKPPTPEELNQFVSEALSGLFRKRRPGGRGDDLRYTLSVSLEEIAAGTERLIEVHRQIHCKRCKGDGAEPGVGKIDCSACEGSGKVPGRRLFRSTCPHCDGQGFVVVNRCKTCDGAGLLTSKDSLKVKIPPGIATGQKLKLRGKGNIPKSGGDPGDLFVLVDVSEHALFTRRGADLVCEVPLLFTEAALGARLVVPTLTGTTTIRVPPGTPNGKVFRLGGRGLKRSDKKGSGDLHIKIRVEIPITLSEEQKAALTSLSETMTSEAYPDRKEYDREVQARLS